jgi:DNA-binding GntR family transcriptional regulator
MRIAELADEVALSDLEAVLQTVEPAPDSDAVDLLALDLAFHGHLVSAAGSERLTRAFEPLSAETRLCLSQREVHDVYWADLVDAHRRILAAIHANDPQLIRQLLHDHMTDSALKLGATPEGT